MPPGCSRLRCSPPAPTRWPRRRRVQEDHLDRSPRQGGPEGAGRARARGRRPDRDRRRPGRQSPRPDLVVRPERNRRRQARSRPASERPELREPDPHRSGRAAGHPRQPTSTASGGLAWRASASFSANGQRPRDNNFLLDGVDNNESWLQSVVIFPSVDALDEFKLQTSTYAAEFGKSLGGVVNLQIKSGANQFHGGALRLPARRRASTPTTSSTTGPGSRGRPSASISSGGRWAAPSGRTGPSSSRTTRACGSGRA